MSINKKEFADRMALKGGITKKAAFQAVGLFVDTLMDYLAEDEKIMFTNFGRFEMKTIRERKGYNPQSRGECIIPGYRKVKFTSSESLADRITERGKGMEADEDYDE